MSALQFDLADGRIVDLFAGSGALGLEALSRGAAHVTFVERAAPVLATLRGNLDILGAEAHCEIVRADALAFVEGLSAGAFDLALADPPYGQGLAVQLAERFADVPFASWLWIEHRASETLPRLPGARTRRYGDTALTAYPAPAQLQ
jgi:16S rRNA (guanine966-N2)-methyltransferase